MPHLAPVRGFLGHIRAEAADLRHLVDIGTLNDHAAGSISAFSSFIAIVISSTGTCISISISTCNCISVSSFITSLILGWLLAALQGKAVGICQNVDGFAPLYSILADELGNSVTQGC